MTAAKIFIDSRKVVFTTNTTTQNSRWAKSSNYTFLLNFINSLRILYENIDDYITIVANTYYINSLTIKFKTPDDDTIKVNTLMRDLIWHAKCGSDKFPIDYSDQYSLYIKRFLYLSTMLKLQKVIGGLVLKPFAKEYMRFQSIVESLCYDWEEFSDTQRLKECVYENIPKVVPVGTLGIFPYQRLKYGECYFIHKLCYIAYLKKGKVLFKMLNSLFKGICSGKSTFITRRENKQYLIQYIKDKGVILGNLNEEFNASMKIGLILNQLQYEGSYIRKPSRLFV